MYTAVKCFILLIYGYPVYGLECVHCANIVLDNSTISKEMQFTLGTFRETFQTPACASESPNRSATRITVKNCPDRPLDGQTFNCGQFNGKINMIGPQQLNFMVNVNIKGCFAVDNGNAKACFSNKATLESQKAALSEYLNLVDEFTLLSITDINGILCTNGVPTTYNGVNITKLSNGNILNLNLLLLLLSTVIAYL